MIAYILEDMKQPVSYLISGIGAAILAYIFMKWIRCCLGKKRKRKKDSISLFLWVAYLVVLARTVYFCRPSLSRNKVNMAMMGTWGTSLRSHVYVIENLMLFIPFGILLPLCFPKARKSLICILSGCLLSIFIETVQYMTQRGNCELDDVIMNTLGTLVGWLVFTGLKKVKYRILL
ncbi:VanZ family protein [Lacrimispora xylanisolvens]|uniref:VanZ family protein n=1 Tax=Lacrimispora xylanisolvens TaxID=384636 RepID=UPI002402B1D4|nr:VanZ family protein [Paenibacillaceae bacterium]